MKYMHESNLLGKIRDNYNGVGDRIQEFYDNTYMVMRNRLTEMDFSSNDDETFVEATNVINDYYRELSAFAKQYKVTSQSKFISSFLEELSIYLFLDNEFVKNETLGIYNKNVYAGLKIGNDLKVNIIDKDVDFCIGKKVCIKIDNKDYELILPVVAVEVKTYLDATMFGEVQFSCKLLKNATPNVRTYVLMETNQVGKDKIIAARYDNVVNELFVLREKKGKLIDYRVLKDYYKQICDDILNTAVEREVKTPGRLINVTE